MGTLSELQNNEPPLTSSFSCMCTVRTDKPILMLWGIDDRFLLQVPLIPDPTALPFVLQLWALHPHLTASTLAYTTTTVPWPALPSGACSTPWPGRHICCHLAVVSICYIKGKQKFVQLMRSTGLEPAITLSSQKQALCKSCFSRGISIELDCESRERIALDPDSMETFPKGGSTVHKMSTS